MYIVKIDNNCIPVLVIEIDTNTGMNAITTAVILKGFYTDEDGFFYTDATPFVEAEMEEMEIDNVNDLDLSIYTCWRPNGKELGYFAESQWIKTQD